MATTSPMIRSTTRQVAYSIVLAALGLALSPISIPTGIAKISPTQHMINVLAGVLVGPWWGLAIAVVMSTVRNIMGTGTPLAFPGSVFGVVLAGLAYRVSRNILLAAVGEVIGTGIIGAIVAAAIVAPTVLHKPMAVTALILPFILSSLTGAVLAVIGLQVLQRAGYVE